MMRKLSAWLNERPHTKAMYLTAIATIVMAIMSAIACYSVVQNAKLIELTSDSLEQSRQALALTRDSVDIQRKEFALRNRPLITLRNCRFAGEARDTSGQVMPRSVELEMENISDIPANALAGYSRAFLNGKQCIETFTMPAALAKGGSVKAPLFLREDIYQTATNAANKFEIVTEITYSGMLGEPPKAYRTYVKAYYSVPENVFKYDQIDYR